MVHFSGQYTGTLIPEIIVTDRVVVDPKVVTEFTDTHIAQRLGYLDVAGLQTALLLSSKHARLGIWRGSR